MQRGFGQAIVEDKQARHPHLNLHRLLPSLFFRLGFLLCLLDLVHLRVHALSARFDGLEVLLALLRSCFNKLFGAVLFLLPPLLSCWKQRLELFETRLGEMLAAHNDLVPAVVVWV